MQIDIVDEGGMNYVYIVKSSRGSMVVKQAAPFVRKRGISTPMTRERSRFEAKALQFFGSVCPHVPQLYHYDSSLSLIAMQYLEPPHIVLNKGLIARIEYPLLADHMSEFFATTLFRSSLLCNTITEHRQAVSEFCENSELNTIMYHYHQSPFDRYFKHTCWTSPELDADVTSIQEDNTIKLEVIRLYTKFCESSQALIHSDFHGGAIMVTQDSTQVIDYEFAFYGPMGHDIGAFFQTLLLFFFAQDSLAIEHNDRENYKIWLLNTLEKTWSLFQQKFIKLWDECWQESCHQLVYKNPELLKELQRKYMEDVFQATLGFCGCSLIGSVIRVPVLEFCGFITDVSKRADEAAQLWQKERQKFKSIDQVIFSLQHTDFSHPGDH